MVPKGSIKNTQLTTPSQLSTGHRNKGLQPDKCGKDERGCTRLTDNRKHVRCEGPHNSLDIQTHHEKPSPPLLLPPTFPSPTSSHSSSEVSSSEPSTSSDGPSSCLTGDNVGETMVLSCSQKETKDSGVDLDSRGGGLPCPDETSEWRSRNKAGTGGLSEVTQDGTLAARRGVGALKGKDVFLDQMTKIFLLQSNLNPQRFQFMLHKS